MVLSPIRTLRVARVKIPVSLLRLVSAAALALPVLAHAAGLGRLTVHSFLGQPLRAEIEVVSLQAGEESSLEAQLASGNAFAQAGIEFHAALNTMRFAVEKRDGKPLILMTTRQPVNEPFLDVLVELRWSTGLFVREYTILLDPPGYEGPKPQPAAGAAAGTSVVAAPGAASAAAPAAASAATSGQTAGTTTSQVSPAMRVEERPMESAAAKPEAKPEPAEPKAAPAPPPSAAAAPAAASAAPSPQGPQTYEVKKGDTLGEIALRYRPKGVTFHQMLIALQRANEDAFIRNNINLVRAGRILTIPDAVDAAAVEPADANRLVFAQHADFAEYRSRLATAVAKAPEAPKPSGESAAGPITVKPEAAKPAAPGDQLKLSRADAKKPGAAATKAAREDDLAARERALKEAQSRVTELEKNVSDLNKLLEIKNQQLAQLQDKAAVPKPAPAAPAKAPEPPKPAPAPQAAMAPEAKPAAPIPTPAPQPVKPVTVAPKPAAEAPKPAAEAPKPAAQTTKPAASAPGTEAPKPAAPKPPAPVAKPKPRPVAPPPPERSFFDQLLEDPTLAAAGIGIVVVLLGGYGYVAWQRKKKSVAKFKDSVLGTTSLAPVGGADAAGAAGPASVSQTSVTQSTAGGVDADDVDPIAEADVYMAYGRDAQAEEILKEALQRDPNRLAVHAKLLEIYANRRDAQAFEQTALKLKQATGGTGPEWDKAMSLGRSIDPGNGLYGGAGETTPTPMPAFAAAAAAAPAVDFDIGGTPSEPAAPAPAPAPAIDLDIGGPGTAPAPAEHSDFSPGGTLIIDNEDSKAASNGLDFDLGGGGDRTTEAAPGGAGGGLDFELPSSPPAEAEALAAAAPAPSSGGGLDFDLNLGGGGGGESRDTSSPALDLSAISLDLGAAADVPAAGGNGNGGDPKWQEVATKLDLAKAYEEMGDKDGARELLNEVLREGDSAQQGQANQLLSKLG